MRLEMLKAGENMTQAEIDFLHRVIGMIAHSGYKEGFYELVGSRAQSPPHWISYSCFWGYLHDRGVKQTVIDEEFQKLNALAQQLNLCHDQIPELRRHLLSNTPSIIKKMLSDRKFTRCLGSDIDLLIKGRGLPDAYKDRRYPKGTGQVVDVFKNPDGMITPFSTWPYPSQATLSK